MIEGQEAMMTRGYVSSFDRERGFGFVSPHGDPTTKVMFRRQALEQGGSNARDLTPGRVVFFEIDPALDEPTPWEVAGTVTTDEDALADESAPEGD